MHRISKECDLTVLITTLDLSACPRSFWFISHPLIGNVERIAVPPEVGRDFSCPKSFPLWYFGWMGAEKWDEIALRDKFLVCVLICVESAFVSATNAINDCRNWQTRQSYQS